jgi:predicted transcriptional regulator
MSEDGRRDVPNARFIEAIEGGAKTTSEIADAVGITRQGADYRLRQLREEGRVDAETVGNTLVWSLVDETE